jgi:dimethylhistidine N-methyltransferase
MHLQQLEANPNRSAMADFEKGLLAENPHIEFKFFYDKLGSHLFSAITELPEYYPTRTEAEIFSLHSEKISHEFSALNSMIDLGAGNCAKAEALFKVLGIARYTAVDVSVDYLAETLEHLQTRHPQIQVGGVGLDFSETLLPLKKCVEGPAIVFYPGSSIGNFSPVETRRFLTQVRALACGGGLLIGVDLVKDKAVLELAYDDPLGVTAAFNLNMLRHVNRSMGANFDVSDWSHLSFYNEQESRIEMHLRAKRAVTIKWQTGSRTFSEGDLLHTENSYKWTTPAFSGLLTELGFSQVKAWTDPKHQFAVFSAHAI